MNQLSNAPLLVFIGPQKTGTSWIHQLLHGNLEDKELMFPRRYGRDFVYDKFVAPVDVLVWPYLAHHPERLASLIGTLNSRGRPFRLIETVRDPDAWLDSMRRFRLKSGHSEEQAAVLATQELDSVEHALRQIRSEHDVETLNVFEPDASDIDTLCSLSGLDRQAVLERRDEPVYATEERSRIASNRLARTFFRVKPFLPRALRNVTKNVLLRKVFFTAKGSGETSA